MTTLPLSRRGYVAAVKMLHNDHYPCRVQLISHIIRDIYRKLPRVLDGSTLSDPREVFTSMVQHLVKLWEKNPTLNKDGIEGDKNYIPVSNKVYRYVSKIVCKSQKMAKDQTSVGGAFAAALFHYGGRSTTDFIAPWIIKSFNEEYDYFVNNAHLDRPPKCEELPQRFEAFEKAFHSLVGSYFSGKEELDAILEDANDNVNREPTERQIQIVFPRIRTPEHSRYFFSRLQNPKWIAIFHNKEIFKDPPPKIVVEGGFRHPHWPASQYLARMANVAPQEVADRMALELL